MAGRWLIVGIVVLLAAAGFCCTSCGDTPVIDPGNAKKVDYKENAINANRYLSEREETNINSYISRRGWNVATLPCGARVYEYEKGTGALLQNDDSVSVRFSVENLAGQAFYTDSVARYMVGRLQPNEGIDAALQTLRHGSRAYVLLPSSTAFGVVGDHYRIPPRTPLVYNIAVL